MAEVELVEGWTAALDFELRRTNSDGTVSVQDLTSMTVSLVLITRGGTTISTTSDTSVVTSTAGLVRYTPSATDITVANSPLYARWRVVDTSSGVAFFPSGNADIYRIRPLGP